MGNLQKIYEDAYKKEWDKRTTVPQTTFIGVGDKVFAEKNFFWCGFNNLKFICNTPMNRKLKSELAEQGIEIRKAYDSGYYIRLKTIGNHGNGDYEIQREAYSAVASYLDSLGYSVDNESRLD